ncbi:MAG TPA: ABC transporter ATP-binding protein [Dongiaceae bacterium]|nr:ABC transporter ATP-binding protein [Dongiaceae bacterium]
MTAADPTPLIEIDGLTVDYRRDGGWFNVINDLSLTIGAGETLGLAGESGCGKSTLASLLLGEARSERRIRSGSIRFDGIDIFALKRRHLQRLRSTRLAFVPQNGGTALTPSSRIGRLFAETLKTRQFGLDGIAAGDRARHYLDLVGLPDPSGALSRYPHQFSGGQQQRITLALALCREPELLVLDEPTTGQDALTRQSLINLLARLRASSRTAMLYVSHDLATLSEISDRIAIMYAGQVVESGPAAGLLARPRHPYADALLASVPRLDSPPDAARMLRGQPAQRFPGEGCRFAPRCRHVVDLCHRRRQVLESVGDGHVVACHRQAEIAHEQVPSDVSELSLLPERVLA